MVSQDFILHIQKILVDDPRVMSAHNAYARAFVNGKTEQEGLERPMIPLEMGDFFENHAELEFEYFQAGDQFLNHLISSLLAYRTQPADPFVG